MEKPEIISMIKELSDAYGASGFEDEAIRTARRYAADVADHVEEDSIRNLFIYRKENTGKKPVLMLDAHSDEVSFIIQAIRPNGTLDFLPLGAWVPNTVPAHKVKIRNKDGKYISGVVASVPPHFMTAAEKGKETGIDQMVIDVGATSKEEVVRDFKIGVGAPVVPDVKAEYNEENGVFLGKAFDCRIGCAVLLEVLHRLAGKELAVDIVGTLTSQEEVGERGAMAAVGHVKPDIAIAFEGAPADDTFTPEYKIQTGLHRGPMLRHIDIGMITNPRFIRYALDVAEEKEIPVQEAARRGGGTNGAVIHVSNGGVPTIIISVPVRYTHSHHCFTAIDDFEKTVDLATAIIEGLNEQKIKEF